MRIFSDLMLLNLVFYNDFIHWLEQFQGTCPYKRFLGIPCPGCGMQTAFIELLKGELWQSIVDYPPLIPLILTVLTLILHLIFKFRHGAMAIKYLFIFTVILIVGNYIAKFI
ncbi:MAG: DUF2752 domain-containing protein [Candidatus Zixiibacteriota bacterium]|nr:MAG: DUF2752 domain-containing protein [candidate division Zixibacteria bacterium]